MGVFIGVDVTVVHGDQWIQVDNSLTVNIGGNSTTTIFKNEFHTVIQNQTVTIVQNQIITVVQNRILTVIGQLIQTNIGVHINVNIAPRIETYVSVHITVRASPEMEGDSAPWFKCEPFHFECIGLSIELIGVEIQAVGGSFAVAVMEMKAAGFAFEYLLIGIELIPIFVLGSIVFLEIVGVELLMVVAEVHIGATAVELHAADLWTGLLIGLNQLL